MLYVRPGLPLTMQSTKDSFNSYSKLPAIGDDKGGGGEQGEDMDEAVTTLQAALRGSLARNKYKRKLGAVVCIQK